MSRLRGVAAMRLRFADDRARARLRRLPRPVRVDDVGLGRATVGLDRGDDLRLRLGRGRLGPGRFGGRGLSSGRRRRDQMPIGEEVDHRNNVDSSGREVDCQGLDDCIRLRREWCGVRIARWWPTRVGPFARVCPEAVEQCRRLGRSAGGPALDVVDLVRRGLGFGLVGRRFLDGGLDGRDRTLVADRCFMTVVASTARSTGLGFDRSHQLRFGPPAPVRPPTPGSAQAGDDS